MKKTNLLMVFVFAIIGLSTTAQITFQKSFEGAGAEFGKDVKQTTDGGYIITGSTSSFGAGSSDVYLIKTDASGDTLWTKTFGGTVNDGGNSVQQCTDGGYIIAGYTSSFGADSTDVYLIKTDANGDTLWTKTFGGTDDDAGNSVQQTTDGGYIIAGSASSFGAGSSDVYLIKTDAYGDTLWARTFGGTVDDEGNSVQQCTDGGYIIAGSTSSFGAGSSDVYFIKTDASGDTLWAKTFGGTANDRGSSVQQCMDGGYIITGSTSSSGSSGFYLIRTDTSGVTLWTKAIGGTVSGSSVQQTTDGGYIVAGTRVNIASRTSYVFLVKTNSIGVVLWAKVFSPPARASGSSVQQTTDGGYIITGSKSWPGQQAILIKTDSLGNSCNQTSWLVNATTPTTVISNPATIVSSPATVVTTPGTLVGSGGIITTPCSTVDIYEVSASLTNHLRANSVLLE